MITRKRFTSQLYIKLSNEGDEAFKTFVSDGTDRQLVTQHETLAAAEAAFEGLCQMATFAGYRVLRTDEITTNTD